MPSFPPIDFTESIKRQRLVYKTDSFSFYRYVWLYLLPVIAVVFLLYIIIFSIFTNSYLPLPLILLAGLFELNFIVNIILFNRFVIVEGKDRETNKKDILTVLADLNLSKSPNSSRYNMITDYRVGKIPLNGRVITILFKDSYVYINMTSLGRTDELSFMYGVSNRLICRNIAKQLKIIQTNR